MVHEVRIIYGILSLLNKCVSYSDLGFDFRRPATADSAKTSNLDSDDNLEDDQSN